MIAAPVHRDEHGRLLALDSYRILDTPPEPLFDSVVALARDLAAAPVAWIGLVARQRLWFKAVSGLPGVREMPREQALCAHAILGSSALEVGDTLEDERFSGHPLAVGPTGLRAYYGLPLTNAEGHALGTLAVLDTRPRNFTPEQQAALAHLAALALGLLESGRQRVEQARLRAVLDDARHDLYVCDARDLRILHANAAVMDRYGASAPGRGEALRRCNLFALLPWMADGRMSERLRHLSSGATTALRFRADGGGAAAPRPVEVEVRRVPAGPDTESMFVFTVGDLESGDIEAHGAAEVRDPPPDARPGDIRTADAAPTGPQPEVEVALRRLHALSSALHADLGDAATDPHAAVEQARGRARRVACMVDSLLQYIADPREPPRLTRVDPAEVFHTAWHDIRERCAGAPVEFVVGELPACFADPALLRIACDNLLSNAVKFTRGRTPARIEVSGATARGVNVLCVRDNGVGFEATAAATLFQPFGRLHDGAGFEGSGLGLALVRRIVERHGGQTWAEGSPHNGACFCLTLPAAPVPV